ncbi:hypothetical protein OIE63_35220 [Streptomyces sp. NBC_01795]|uniref:hypothetical protein n=1 Tax=unclassified Streptomyces TaxID=2593676 RepID=UPI002DDA31FA|nr:MULTISPECIES: hypothetical protein [unclassified Streptomyces]WSA96229.1 hypothetical protein OIE63_35220 [Streptomyces sp. NBC_01795]WSS11147.1 hypothetical protein OG533_03925 [Streptomyces sp. NBC_01186]
MLTADFEKEPPVPDIAVPAAVTLSHEPAYADHPRSLSEHTCRDLRHWSTPAFPRPPPRPRPTLPG